MNFTQAKALELYRADSFAALLKPHIVLTPVFNRWIYIRARGKAEENSKAFNFCHRLNLARAGA
jgi:hypothetical protein